MLATYEKFVAEMGKVIQVRTMWILMLVDFGLVGPFLSFISSDKGSFMSSSVKACADFFP